LALVYLQGVLLGLLLIQAFIHRSWANSVTLCLLATAVLVAGLTQHHPVDPFMSMLVLLVANTLLLFPPISFTQLITLNLLLMIHVIAGFVSFEFSLLLLSILVVVQLVGQVLKNQTWLNWCVMLLILLWVMLLEHTFWPMMICCIWLVIQSQQVYRSLTTQQDQSSNDDSWAKIEAAKTTERSRIYQNIHDDVGAELLKLMYQLDNNEQKTQAKTIMNKLRQAVASTAYINISAEQLINEIADEASSRCLAAGIDFVTEINAQSNLKLSEKQPIHLQRTIRELINNCIKHSQAKQIKLIASIDDQSINITLKDDGVGLNSQYQQGKGIHSLTKRIHQAGGKIQWQTNQPNGTQVELSLSL
jgi:signal transduction histidine kinase